MASLSLLVQLILIALAILSDYRSRRIANGLVLLLLLHGLATSWLFDTPARDFTGALAGSAVGLALWLPAWLAGVLGAGDVKFFAAGAAWIGPSLTWRTALVAALVGGVYAGWWMLRIRLAAWRMPVAPRPASAAVASTGPVSSDAEASLPYAVPLGAALVLTMLAPHVVRSWWVWS